MRGLVTAVALGLFASASSGLHAQAQVPPALEGLRLGQLRTADLPCQVMSYGFACQPSDTLTLLFHGDTLTSITLSPPSDTLAQTPVTRWTRRWRAFTTRLLGTPDSVRTTDAAPGLGDSQRWLTAYWTSRPTGRWVAELGIVQHVHRDLAGESLYSHVWLTLRCQAFGVDIPHCPVIGTPPH
jgi:hypothetical protein